MNKIKSNINKIRIMTTNSPKKRAQKEYLNELMKKVKKGSSDQPFAIGQMIGSSLIKIQQELQIGKLSILQSNHSNKKESYQQKMQLLNKEMNKNDLLFKKAKQQLLVQKKIEHENKKNQMQEKGKESKEMVKRWTLVQQQLQQRKRAIEELKNKIQAQEEEKRKKQQEDQISFQKLEKRKKIQQKMKQIEQQKQLRQERNIQAQQKIQQLNPKFKEIEQKFRQFEEEIKFEEKILRQNHKISFKLDHEAIKAHEKAYLTKVQQRKDAHSRSPKSADRKQKPFNILLGRDQQKAQEQKQKRKRRKQFQEKLKQIPVPIDESKKVKVQIAIDKGKHRIKYNFLGQKALNDFQIFGQFRDFQLNVNAREIGKQYLRQLPQITKNSRITKSHSLNSLKQSQERPKYKDYLHDLKSKRSQIVLSQKQQLDNLVKNQGDKEKAFEKMAQKSKFYELQAKRKLSEAGRSNGLQGSIRKSKQADEIYLKSIRAKLACLEMQS